MKMILAYWLFPTESIFDAFKRLKAYIKKETNVARNIFPEFERSRVARLAIERKLFLAFGDAKAAEF